MKTNYKLLTHFFGEMDLNLNKSYEELLKKADHISECCGYFTEGKRDKFLKLFGREGEKFVIIFDDKKPIKVLTRREEFNLSKLPDYSGYKNGFSYCFDVKPNEAGL